MYRTIKNVNNVSELEYTFILKNEKNKQMFNKERLIRKCHVLTFLKKDFNSQNLN